MIKKFQESGTVPEVFSLLSLPLPHFLEVPTFWAGSTLGKHLGQEEGGREATGIFSVEVQTQSPKQTGLWVQL